MPPLTPDAFTGLISSFVETLTVTVTDNPVPYLAVAGFVAMVMFARTAARNRQVPTDPARLFTTVQRTEGFARAGGRCEMESFLFFRCRTKAHHGDHHYPWSKGGSTSMSNFVAACARHNTSKGAKIPTSWQTMRMEARRRKYFPQGLTVKAGEHFAHR